MTRRSAAFNPDAPPAQQFRLPHNIAISRDVDDEDGVGLRTPAASQTGI